MLTWGDVINEPGYDKFSPEEKNAVKQWYRSNYIEKTPEYNSVTDQATKDYMVEQVFSVQPEPQPGLFSKFMTKSKAGIGEYTKSPLLQSMGLMGISNKPETKMLQSDTSMDVVPQTPQTPQISQTMQPMQDPSQPVVPTGDIMRKLFPGNIPELSMAPPLTPEIAAQSRTYESAINKQLQVENLRRMAKQPGGGDLRIQAFAQGFLPVVSKENMPKGLEQAFPFSKALGSLSQIIAGYGAASGISSPVLKRGLVWGGRELFNQAAKKFSGEDVKPVDAIKQGLASASFGAALGFTQGIEEPVTRILSAVGIGGGYSAGKKLIEKGNIDKNDIRDIGIFAAQTGIVEAAWILFGKIIEKVLSQGTLKGAIHEGEKNVIKDAINNKDWESLIKNLNEDPQAVNSIMDEVNLGWKDILREIKKEDSALADQLKVSLKAAFYPETNTTGVAGVGGSNIPVTPPDTSSIFKGVSDQGAISPAMISTFSAASTPSVPAQILAAAQLRKNETAWILFGKIIKKVLSQDTLGAIHEGGKNAIKDAINNKDWESLIENLNKNSQAVNSIMDEVNLGWKDILREIKKEDSALADQLKVSLKAAFYPETNTTGISPVGGSNIPVTPPDTSIPSTPKTDLEKILAKTPRKNDYLANLKKAAGIPQKQIIVEDILKNQSKDNRRKIIQNRIKQNKKVPPKLLEEFKDEPWVKTQKHLKLPKITEIKPKSELDKFLTPKQDQQIQPKSVLSSEKIEQKEAQVKPLPATKVEPKASSEKLRTLAKKLQSQIDAKRHSAISQQRPTARRTRIVSEMEKEADRIEKVQAKLIGLADAVDAGTLPDSLNKIRNKAQVEDLLFSEKMPGARLHVSSFQALLSDAKGAKGINSLQDTFDSIKMRTGNDISIKLKDEKELNAIEQLIKMAKSKGKNISHYNIDLGSYKRMIAAGIDNAAKFDQAKKDIASLGKVKPVIPVKEQQIKILERKLIGNKIPGYFPTPKPLAEEMVNLANIKQGDRVLEPSAGKGNIADVIKTEGIIPDVIEPSETLRNILKLKGYKPVGRNFEEYKPDKAYDVIIMNPPFEKNQDIDHIKHAYSMLAPGGRLIAIMGEGSFFRSNKKIVEFRKWLYNIMGETRKLPDFSFSESGTNVNARLVAIAKPEKTTDVNARLVAIAKPEKTTEQEQEKYNRLSKIIRPVNKSDIRRIPEIQFRGKSGVWRKIISKDFTGWSVTDKNNPGVNFIDFNEPNYINYAINMGSAVNVPNLNKLASSQTNILPEPRALTTDGMFIFDTDSGIMLANKKYYNYFKTKYKNPIIKYKDTTSPWAVYDGDKVVGIIAPIISDNFISDKMLNKIINEKKLMQLENIKNDELKGIKFYKKEIKLAYVNEKGIKSEYGENIKAISYKGLAIHHPIENDGTEGKGYNITHIESGRGLDVRFRGINSAKRMVIKLSKIDNFTKTLEDLHKNEDIMEAINRLSISHEKANIDDLIPQSTTKLYTAPNLTRAISDVKAMGKKISAITEQKYSEPNKQVDEWVRYIKGHYFANKSMEKQLMAEYPDEAERVKEGLDMLNTGVAKTTLQKEARELFNEVGNLAEDAGVINSRLENYVPFQFANSKIEVLKAFTILKKDQQEWLEKVDPVFSVKTGHAKKRKSVDFADYQRRIEALNDKLAEAGSDIVLKPQTDIVKLMVDWERDVMRKVINQRFVDFMSEYVNADGEPMIVTGNPDTYSNPNYKRMPENIKVKWVGRKVGGGIQLIPLKYYVHKDVYPAIQNFTSKDLGSEHKWVQNYLKADDIIKRLKLYNPAIIVDKMTTRLVSMQHGKPLLNLLSGKSPWYQGKQLLKNDKKIQEAINDGLGYWDWSELGKLSAPIENGEGEKIFAFVLSNSPVGKALKLNDKIVRGIINASRFQMWEYLKNDFIKKGFEDFEAGRMAAEIANRSTYSIPRHLMNKNFRTLGRIAFFSRNSVLGSLQTAMSLGGRESSIFTKKQAKAMSATERDRLGWLIGLFGILIAFRNKQVTGKWINTEQRYYGKTAIYKDDDGRIYYVNTLDYAQDYVNILFGQWGKLGGKLHPIVSEAGALRYGVDPFTKKKISEFPLASKKGLTDRALHVAKQLTPGQNTTFWAESAKNLFDSIKHIGWKKTFSNFSKGNVIDFMLPWVGKFPSHSWVGLGMLYELGYEYDRKREEEKNYIQKILKYGDKQRAAKELALRGKTTKEIIKIISENPKHAIFWKFKTMPYLLKIKAYQELKSDKTVWENLPDEDKRSIEKMMIGSIKSNSRSRRGK